MKEHMLSSSPEDLINIVEKILKKYPSQRIFALKGPMGVGKTTFMIYLCRFLKCKNTVSSPTFSIVNEYELASGNMLYHFDFYRIKNLKEAVDIGLDDYFYSGNYCFMEWAEKIEPLLPPETHIIEIEIDKIGNRVFDF
ncbi:MAG: tRNA (adenosine(37)-N6)-threonylcarbamoyltransferase complex ATPase subunit type 1 TsaE [Bacteroidales bacterium]|jgi:tRNA threonylcarbamoyladenosine biosynthesis protein TsaE|nr:tRNA (adenosine(37)-N6)-threonylcarbamoyltransferase complex ATPase subunit type 1 TsaE [Bacteroidales bacterium]MDD2687843.1 tRNA (adenosine(37)-N6)-threonylcarbamoyltransferase complex ATPase subunit type 1 TsaE [Bacteroidales bacterium]MDD3329991.1 tRNA (adenosine(37)-N6)-threonylcarbamoyltransferase complex ATPase subunit type 1 TsaE [Bacteroidales bacterium]MDD3690660.1 tRNA (adenosine(37)-N6)-threonylcarbamoyltransferase complex ATPase subunit type 1 TsaE [Bacteroidales bacterium]MDD40